MRKNVFEDIVLCDNSYSFPISTFDDLVTARRVNINTNARVVSGMISDEELGKALETMRHKVESLNLLSYHQLTNRQALALNVSKRLYRLACKLYRLLCRPFLAKAGLHLIPIKIDARP